MFVHRKIKVSISGDGGNAVFEGLRTLVRITKAGSPYYGQAEIVLYGLSLSHINDLSTKALLYRPSFNFEVTVEAGDNVNGMSRVFKGTVQQSWGDFTNMPSVAFYISAFGSTAPAAVGPATPTSATGDVKVAPLIQKLAQQGQLQFANYGVDKVLHNVYTWGSPWKQIREIAQAVNVNAYVDDKVCKLWPRGQAIPGTMMVSRETGMRDYPSFTRNGIQVKVEFSRAIDYGTSIQVVSDLKDANGKWEIIKIDYDLAAELPGGNWFAIIEAKANGAPVAYGI